MLAEISELDGSSRLVRGAVIRLGKHCQAVSASGNGGRRKSGTELVNDGGVIGVLVAVWSERRWNCAVSVVGVQTSWWNSSNME
eukprot:944906-Rhodomonas_salina.3